MKQSTKCFSKSILIFLTTLGILLSDTKIAFCASHSSLQTETRRPSVGSHIDKHPAVREMYIDADKARVKSYEQTQHGKEMLQDSRKLREEADKFLGRKDGSRKR